MALQDLRASTILMCQKVNPKAGLEPAPPLAYAGGVLSAILFRDYDGALGEI